MVFFGDTFPALMSERRTKSTLSRLNIAWDWEMRVIAKAVLTGKVGGRTRAILIDVNQ